ncbi:MAG: hypothetical protein KIT87_24265 [Anaerolineae bacterium]|nr:hypothetical protein [Anaerolineae bacterium]
MRSVDTANETATMEPRNMEVMEASSFPWLRRRAATLFALLAVAGIWVAVLGAIRTQAQPSHAAVALFAVHPSEGDTGDVGMAAPALSATDGQASERNMQRLRDLNEVYAPSASVPDARTYERTMQRLLELNTMDDPLAHALLPWRDASQREGPF